ncbi:hypothetical protein V6N13_130081 [Hibiscus sabdariffa]
MEACFITSGGLVFRYVVLKPKDFIRDELPLSHFLQDTELTQAEHRLQDSREKIGRPSVGSAIPPAQTTVREILVGSSTCLGKSELDNVTTRFSHLSITAAQTIVQPTSAILGAPLVQYKNSSLPRRPVLRLGSSTTPVQTISHPTNVIQGAPPVQLGISSMPRADRPGPSRRISRLLTA